MWFKLLFIIVPLLFAGGGWLFKKHDETKQARIETLTAELNAAHASLSLYRTAYAADEVRAEKDETEKAALAAKIEGLNGYIEKLEDRDTVCLSGPDTDSLRDLWK